MNNLGAPQQRMVNSPSVNISGEEEAQGVVRSWADKTFHVSPFLPLQGGYRFRTRPPSAQVSGSASGFRAGNARYG